MGSLERGEQYAKCRLEWEVDMFRCVVCQRFFDDGIEEGLPLTPAADDCLVTKEQFENV